MNETNAEKRKQIQDNCLHLPLETVREDRELITYCKICGKVTRRFRIPEGAH